MGFIEEFFEICEEKHAIGANIVITNKDEILDKASFGYRDKEENLLSTSDTIYRIASISKTVGAIGLLQLVEKGLINLKEDISTYLGYKVRNPKYPNHIITVEMLTTQTSSILDGYDDENPKYDDIRKGYNGVNGWPIDVTLKDLLTNPDCEYYTPLTFADYKPGERWTYSNFGCGIMACIIEKVSGEYYVDYMENHVFKPLGLDASFKASRIIHKEKIAKMYAYYNGELHNHPKEKFINSTLKQYPLGDNFRGPAGGLFISMPDLSVIMRMFLNYGTYNGVKILNRDTVELMYQMHWCGSPTGEDYRAKGIQMKILNHHEIPFRGHTGGAYGVRSYMFFNLEKEIGTCFITNGIYSDNEYKICQELFDGTQRFMIDKYVKFAIPIKAKFYNQKIVLENRKIIDDELFLLDKKFIKGMHLADTLNTVGIFKEDDLTFKINNLLISHVIYYNNAIYIPFKETLDTLEIKYSIHDDYIEI